MTLIIANKDNMRADRNISAWECIDHKATKIFSLNSYKDSEKKRLWGKILFGIAWWAAAINIFSNYILDSHVVDGNASLYHSLMNIRREIQDKMEELWVRWGKEDKDLMYHVIWCDWFSALAIDGVWCSYTGTFLTLWVEENLVKWLLHFGVSVEDAFEYVHNMCPTAVWKLEDHLSLAK